ncbi:single stranded DNA-binding domain-containing protein [Saccharomonospora glauca]|uniref:Single-stranded DNA-binding protein n=1 Tax=Saccharomonospora glauca K62 TaxID=928724 RepID=I1CWE2_9PSEU|nr:hypothetical protein [Saccharomonospora glauca]EIE97016.1 hypothetical protein SacglDRAFT_00050 [Saccharomonospora glauca K62]
MSEQDPTTQAPREPDVDPELEAGFYGFVASKPKFSDENGKPYLFFRAGQIHYDYHPDGSRTQLPTTFHTIVAFEGAAVHGDTHLQKRDVFLAFGRMEDKPHPDTGASRKRFIANRFGHDLARMNYQVGTPRRLVDMQQQGRETPDREQPSREQSRSSAFEPVQADQVEAEQPARAM